jgi:hypothetical protein
MGAYRYSGGAQRFFQLAADEAQVELVNTLREAFGFNIPMTPAVVLPMLVIATILVAYLVYFVTLRIVRGAAKRASITIDGRVMWLFEHYLFPLLIVFGLLSLKSSVRSDRETTILM